MKSKAFNVITNTVWKQFAAIVLIYVFPITVHFHQHQNSFHKMIYQGLVSIIK